MNRPNPSYFYGGLARDIDFDISISNGEAIVNLSGLSRNQIHDLIDADKIDQEKDFINQYAFCMKCDHAFRLHAKHEIGNQATFFGCCDRCNRHHEIPNDLDKPNLSWESDRFGFKHNIIQR